MYKKIVVPVMLILFILQTSSLLFANEKTEAKAEIGVKVEDSTVATAETEVKSEEDTEAVTEPRG